MVHYFYVISYFFISRYFSKKINKKIVDSGSTKVQNKYILYEFPIDYLQYFMYTLQPILLKHENSFQKCLGKKIVL